MTRSTLMMKAIKHIDHACGNLDMVSHDYDLSPQERDTARALKLLLLHIQTALECDTTDYHTVEYARDFDLAYDKELTYATHATYCSMEDSSTSGNRKG